MVPHERRLGRGARDGVTDDQAVIRDRVEGRLGHGVHASIDGEVNDVAGVGVGRILDTSGGPQRALRVGALPSERLPRWARERCEMSGPGKPGVGDGGLSAQGGGRVGAHCIKPRINGHIDAADEE